MINSCYVPNCDEEFGGGSSKRLIFKAPKNLLFKWLEYLPQRDTNFDPNVEGVCIKHFEQKYIQKEEIINVCGSKEVFPLDPWILTPDAIPTLSLPPPPPPKTNRDTFDPSVDEEHQVSQNEEHLDESLSSPIHDTTHDFEDLIRFDGSINGISSPSAHNAENSGNETNLKRKQANLNRPGPLSKKIKASGENDENIGYAGRSPHLKRDIIRPSRIRDSFINSEDDEPYEDDLPSPESPPSPKARRGRGRPSSKKTKSRRKTPRRNPSGQPVKIRVTPVTNARTLGRTCFVEYCTRNDKAALFKMPQNTREKFNEWMRHLPKRILDGITFDPSIHFICEEHFDKKHVMNTPRGKVLTGDAYPTIFLYSPKEAFAFRGNSGTRKSSILSNNTRVKDGFEVEINADTGKAQPLTVVTIDDEEESTIVKNPVKKSGVGVAKKSTSNPPTARKVFSIPRIIGPGPSTSGKILDIKDPGYSLQYIYDMRQRIQLPQAEFWIFRMMTDKETKLKCIFIAEIVARLEKLMIRRSVRIRYDLTFRVEANGLDFTQMFNETGNKVDSLYKLQEMVLDLSAFKVCEGWSGFENLDANSSGRKVEGIWFANNCEGLNLNSARCRPCLALKSALLIRKSGLSLSTADPSALAQIRKLPKDDPLYLQLQIQEMSREKTKLKYELGMAEKREARLQERLKQYESGNNIVGSIKIPPKGKTVYVTAAAPQTMCTTTTTVGIVNNNSKSVPNINSIQRPQFQSKNTVNTQNNSVRPRSSTPITIAPRPPNIRRQTPIIVSASTTQTSTLTTSSPNISTTVLAPQPQLHPPLTTINPIGVFQHSAILTPTFVLAQGSGTEIGHQTVDVGSSGGGSVPGIQKQSVIPAPGSTDPEELTLLSL